MHSCDETCRSCVECYVARGVEACDATCVHARATSEFVASVAWRWAVERYGELWADLFVSWLRAVDDESTAFDRLAPSFEACFPDVSCAIDVGDEEILHV